MWLLPLGGSVKCRWNQRVALALVTLVICLVTLAYFGATDMRNATSNEVKTVVLKSATSGTAPSVAVDGAKSTQESQLDSPSSTTELNSEESWNHEYRRRLESANDVCKKYDVKRVRTVWRLYTNRVNGHTSHCTTKQCPVLVDEKKLYFFCFIQKVGSTTMKEYFLNFGNVSIDVEPAKNNSAFHMEANDVLHRVSPMFYPEYVQRRFYKVLFVRHPFDRLVSAFIDKGEPSREERPFFYHTYWDKIMGKFRGDSNVTADSRPSFKEFVKYLLQTQPVFYDEHWSPYWSRCDPCWVPYDFIGKLETVDHDLPYLLKQAGLELGTRLWENKSKTNKRSVTMKYFNELTTQEIIELYKTYFLDFKLFGYSVQDFLPGQNLAAIDESVNLYELVY